MFKRLFKTKFKMPYRKISKEESLQKGYTTRGQSVPNINSAEFIGTWTNIKKHVIRIIGVDVDHNGVYITLSDGTKKSAKMLDQFKLFRLSTDPNYVVSSMDYANLEDEGVGAEIPDGGIMEKYRGAPPKIDTSAFKKMHGKKDKVVLEEQKVIDPPTNTNIEYIPKENELVIKEEERMTETISQEKSLLYSFFTKKKKTTSYNLLLDLPIDKMMLTMLLDMEGVDLDLVCETLSEKITKDTLKKSIKSILENFIDPEDDVEVED